MNITSVDINSSEVIRFEILLRLFGCENFLGPLRNGPLAGLGTSRSVLGKDTFPLFTQVYKK